MKRYVSSRAVCPLYRDESKMMVRCGRDEAKIHRVFATSTDAAKHKSEMCKGNYKRCKIYRILTEDNNGVED